jgi:hypothetical protein
VSNDLPGDDRPDTVRAIYAEAFSWLRTGGIRTVSVGLAR